MANGKVVNEEPLLTEVKMRIRDVRVGPDGAVYVLTDSGLSLIGELKVERILRTGFLHAGQLVKGLAESGRRSVNLPPHTLQSPSHSSYS